MTTSGKVGKDTRYDMAAQYLQRLTGDENTPVTFQVFDDTPAKDPKKARIYHGTLKQHFRQLDAHNNDGCGVFCTVNTTDLKGRGMANIVAVRAVLADDDDGVNTVSSFPLRPHMAVRSSTVGDLEKKQFYWITDTKDFNQYDGVIERLVQSYKVCAGGSKGVNRVFRQPGLYHMKNPKNPQLVEIIHMTDEEPYSWGRILKAFPPILNGNRGANKLEEAVTNDPILKHLRAHDYVKKELSDGRVHIWCPWGTDNPDPDKDEHDHGAESSTTYFVAHTNGYKHGHFKCQHEHCDKRTREDFLRAIGLELRQNHREEPPHPAERCAVRGPKVKCYSLEDLGEYFSRDYEWIWGNHIPKGIPIMVNGREGTGKTTICLQVAKEMLELHPESMIMWFATEGTVSDTYIKACEMGIDMRRFQIPAKNIDGDPEFIFNFKYQAERDLLHEILAGATMEVIAVFIDSVRGMTEQSVNDEETGNTMRKINGVVCDRHKAALIYLHHWNKKDTKSLLDKNTGSTAITAAVRLVLSVIPQTKYIRKVIVGGKNNLGREVEALEVMKNGHGIEIYDPAQGGIITQKERCEEFLLDILKDKKELPQKEIEARGAKLGLNINTIKDVKANMPIESRKEGSTWYWRRRF